MIIGGEEEGRCNLSEGEKAVGQMKWREVEADETGRVSEVQKKIKLHCWCKDKSNVQLLLLENGWIYPGWSYHGDGLLPMGLPCLGYGYPAVEIVPIVP